MNINLPLCTFFGINKFYGAVLALLYYSGLVTFYVLSVNVRSQTHCKARSWKSKERYGVRSWERGQAIFSRSKGKGFTQQLKKKRKLLRRKYRKMEHLTDGSEMWEQQNKADSFTDKTWKTRGKTGFGTIHEMAFFNDKIILVEAFFQLLKCAYMFPMLIHISGY